MRVVIEQLVFRPVRESDIEGVSRLAFQAQSGLSTLPKDKTLLEAIIKKSVRSFSKQINSPYDEVYLFVLEDLSCQKIVGTASVFSSIGVSEPFYTFRIERKDKTFDPAGIRAYYHELTLRNESLSASEVGTLYLDPEYRAKGVGRFLSVARFLFMGKHLPAFRKYTIAELRGVSDASGNCPFWDSVMKTFFGLTFNEADLLSQGSKEFITRCMPQYPLVIETFSPEVQKVIGQTHENTVGAKKILMAEGFEDTDCVDIFDAGPKIKVETSQIKAIKRLTKCTNYSMEDSLIDSSLYLVSSGKGADFKAYCTVAKESENQVLRLEKRKAWDLSEQVSVFDSYMKLYPHARQFLHQELSYFDSSRPVSEKSFLRKFAQWYQDSSCRSAQSLFEQ